MHTLVPVGVPTSLLISLIMVEANRMDQALAEEEITNCLDLLSHPRFLINHDQEQMILKFKGWVYGSVDVILNAADGLGGLYRHGPVSDPRYRVSEKVTGYYTAYITTYCREHSPVLRRAVGALRIQIRRYLRTLSTNPPTEEIHRVTL